ncbi:MAG TPA: TonB-dependent receptor plug domain-containing protein, partial [Candidatus Didemnitutus sp.]|nr:TonB-dependent receptor plug domain-containing protein [Candidatus Didemnitutus sp.]
MTGPRLTAQTANPTNTNASDTEKEKEKVVVLDPFTVTAETEGYQAVDTLGGARVQTKLRDTPSALTVVTKTLMDDLGVRDAQDLYKWTTNTEVSGLSGNFSGVASRGTGVSSNAEAARLLNPNSINRARGLTAMDNTRNYFSSEIPWDSFNISRVDISRGPNSFLFGVGSPSGISNYSTNEALFKNQGNVELRVGSFGSTRESLDYNRVIVPDQLAVRVDLLNDKEEYQQDPAFNHSQRAYGALRFDPKLFNNDSGHLKIQVNAESGKVRSNNPRILPPTDFLTGYFQGGLNKGGYDPFLYSGQQLTGAGSYPTLSPWVNG